MYQLFIADADQLVMRGIQSLVNFDELAVTLGGFFQTGKQMMEAILQKCPEMVLLDVDLPDISGFELIRAIQSQMRRPPLFIIISHRKHFEDMREAVQLRVFDYILKSDLTEEKLYNVIERAKMLIDQEEENISLNISKMEYVNKRSMRAVFFERLLNDWFNEPIDLETEAQAISFLFPAYGVLYFYLPSKVNDTFSSFYYAQNLIEKCFLRFFPCYVNKWEKEGIVCIVGFQQAESQYTSLLQNALDYIIGCTERFANKEIWIGVSQICHSLREIPIAFQNSRKICLCNRGNDAKYMFCDSDSKALQSFQPRAYQKLFSKALNAYDEKAVSELFSTIITQYMRNGQRMQDIFFICFHVLRIISSILPDNEETRKFVYLSYDDPYEILREIHDAGTARAWVQSLSDGVCSLINKKQYTQNLLLPSIMNYIDEHIMENLSVQNLADAFRISPGYVSVLFKKYSTVSFSVYVKGKKVQKAKELLSQGISIQTVADQLGYSDPYYFSHIFRSETGISPKGFILQNGQSSQSEK